MWRLALYLSKNFLLTWLSVVFGFLALIGLLDSLANGGDIMAGDGTFLDTFRYMGLRAPVIFDRIFVFTIMVAILLTFVSLIRNHELVALLGFGLSAFKQFLVLAPAVLFAGLLSIGFIDIFMPPAVQSLQAWGIGEYKQSTVTQKKPLWLEDGTNIVRAAGRPDLMTLTDVEIFERDDTGTVTQAIWAERARFDGERWTLTGVQTLPVAGNEEGMPRNALRPPDPQQWNTRQTPTSIARFASDPRDLDLLHMYRFSQKGNSGSQPRFAYAFWFLHRITRPLAVLVLLMCAVPIMQQTNRQSTGDQSLIFGIFVGFIFLIIDGALSTFAISGGLSVNMAIILPLIVFTVVGAWLLLRTESLSLRRN